MYGIHFGNYWESVKRLCKRVLTGTVCTSSGRIFLSDLLAVERKVEQYRDQVYGYETRI